MSKASRIDYFPVDVDFLEDPKVDDFVWIMSNEGQNRLAGWAACGRWFDLLCTIYKNGFYIEVDSKRARQLSRKLDMSVDELLDFIQTIVDCELLDKRMWEKYNVITSDAIQKRFFNVAKRRSQMFSEEDAKYWILDDKGNPKQTEEAEIEENKSEKAEKDNSCEQLHTIADNCEQLHTIVANCGPEIKERKGKIKERKKKDKEENSSFLSCLHKKSSSKVYSDSSGGSFKSRIEALKSQFSIQCPNCSFENFAKEVSICCPGGCRHGPEQARECYSMIMDALSRFDSSKGKNPAHFVCKILREDRSIK